MEEQLGKKGQRVLVVDDDPAILRLIGAILGKEGYVVVTARDGREAYGIMQQDASFIAGIFDAVMPHIEGPDLVRQMRRDPRLARVPVMMMTAEQNLKIPSDSFAAGAVIFLPKPFTKAQLLTMMRMLIDSSGT